MPSSRKRTLKTGRGKYLKGWSKQQPGYHQRTIMMRKCGHKCFLGPNNTFPICTKNTCKVNKKGVYSAYIRAREYGSHKMHGTHRHTKKVYRKIANKAHKMIY